MNRIKTTAAAVVIAAAGITGLAACGSSHSAGITQSQASAQASAAASQQAAKDAAKQTAAAAEASQAAAIAQASQAAASLQAAVDKAAVAKRAAGVAAAVPAPAPAYAAPEEHAQIPCGAGVYVAPNTSCPFAENVQAVYLSQIGTGDGYVTAYSSVTGDDYQMYCTDLGGGTVTCTGGNNALLYFYN
jgi:hypothetical protein